MDEFILQCQSSLGFGVLLCVVYDGKGLELLLQSFFFFWWLLKTPSIPQSNGLGQSYSSWVGPLRGKVLLVMILSIHKTQTAVEMLSPRHIGVTSTLNLISLE